MKINKINGNVVCPFCGNELLISYVGYGSTFERGIIGGIESFSAFNGVENKFLDYQEQSTDGIEELSDIVFGFDCCGKTADEDELDEYDIIRILEGRYKINTDNTRYEEYDNEKEIEDNKSKSIKNLLKNI